MIAQYLPQTNESVTVAKSKIFLHLNKASVYTRVNEVKGDAGRYGRCCLVEKGSNDRVRPFVIFFIFYLLKSVYILVYILVYQIQGHKQKLSISSPLYSYSLVLNYKTFNFFDLKFNHPSYLKKLIQI